MANDKTQADPSYFREILMSMGEGIMFADHANQIVFVNAAVEQIRGVKAENFLGRDLLSIHSPRAREHVGALLTKLRDGTLPFHTRPLESRGKRLENTYYPVRDSAGRFTGTLMISRDVTEKELLRQENSVLREQIMAEHTCGDLLGKSAAMQPVFQIIRATAALDSTILVTGESGTGKELVTRAIHQQSRRCQHPFIKVNCAALPEQLLEAELFGFEKGAFTGAIRERKGKFEQAHRGTIFLDEIGEMPFTAQSKLLRVIQERTVERIGASREIAIDVRIVAATNRDIRQEIAKGRFREDLFYRLNVIPLHLPPLRERHEDILPLAGMFLTRFAREMGRLELTVSVEAKQALLSHSYPGNVRELKNAIERSVALCPEKELRPEDLPPEFSTTSTMHKPAATAPAPKTALLATNLDECERAMIGQALETSGNRRAEAARLLGISRKTLWKKLKQYQM